MTTYGYGGGYSTTTYSAQGGIDGGGFVQGGGYGGSQAGSQDGSGGSKTYGKESLRPVTIKQIIDANQPYPDAEFKIDGVEVTQLSFIGQIHSISMLATTNTTYKVDDGTGLIEVKQWTDTDAEPDSKRPPPVEGQYLHIWGRLRAFNDKRHVGARIIRVITDYNEISMHLLEATAVHLYFVRGPPGGAGSVRNEGGDSMFVERYGAENAVSGNKKALPNLSASAKRVFALLQSAPQSNEGLHVTSIAQQLGTTTQEVFKAGDELLTDGLVYTTVDDESWAVLEY